jgi:hypothetical protein
MGRTSSIHGDIRKAYNIFVKKPHRKKPFERSKNRWEHDINTDLEIRCEGVHWIRLVLD